MDAFPPDSAACSVGEDHASEQQAAAALSSGVTVGAPQFSIVTPVYNGARTLEATVLSVKAQSGVDFEHLVIDDGSRDDGATITILRRHPHLRSWSRPNRGQNATMNEGLEAARGEWILFLCADDLLAGPEVLRTVADSIRRKPDADVHYGPWMTIDAEGRLLPDRPFCAPLPPFLFRYVYACSHCAMYVRRRRLLEESIRFDPLTRFAGDVDWILQLVGAGFRFRYVKAVLAHYRVHATQTSRTRSVERKAELQRILARHHVSPAPRFLINRLLELRRSFLRAYRGRVSNHPVRQRD